MREAAAGDTMLSHSDYERWRDTQLRAGREVATVATIRKRFGTWFAAELAAGISSPSFDEMVVVYAQAKARLSRQGR